MKKKNSSNNNNNHAKRQVKFFDTSALLNGNFPEEQDYISSTVLRELENIKNAGEKKSSSIKQMARKVARELLTRSPQVFMLTETQWKVAKKFYDLCDTPDNRILAEVFYLNHEYKDICAELQTSDICLYLLAKKMLIPVHFCAANEQKGGLYTGYIEVDTTEKELASLYSYPEKNPYNLLTNQYIILYLEGKEVDILRWTGKKMEPLHCKDINNKFMDPVRPRDKYQRMAMDLLENPEIPVKLIQGCAGSGKDYISTAVALDKVFRREKNKIYFIRNLIDLKDAPQIGYLQGSLEEKISWGLGPITDIVGGEEGLRYIEEEGIIEQLNLGFIRGRNLEGIIYCTELQNTTESAVQSILSRAAEGTELFFNADLKQIDKQIFQEKNGVVSLQQNLKGNSLFGAVYLPNSHRSAVAELAGLLNDN